MVESATRKMHTPAYWPELCGVKADDQSGVVVDVKKIISIESMPMVVDMGVDVAAGMVFVADAPIGIDMDISLARVSVACSW